jgi:hypothetical protein
MSIQNSETIMSLLLEKMRLESDNSYFKQFTPSERKKTNTDDKPFKSHIITHELDEIIFESPDFNDRLLFRRGMLTDSLKTGYVPVLAFLDKPGVVNGGKNTKQKNIKKKTLKKKYKKN